jgi:kynurenine formamidase
MSRKLRSRHASSAIRLALLVVGISGTLFHAQTATGVSRPLVTRAEYVRWQTELSNWGRWGKDDELGALNLITPAKRKQATALVKDGISVSLASDAAIKEEVDVPCPVDWQMVSLSPGAAMDRIAYPCIHGAGTTHLDAFSHVFFNGKMWNGYEQSSFVSKEGGAKKNSILTMKSGIVTRAVLYDIPKLKGVAFLEPGTRIFVEDLEAWERKSGVRAGPGDALLLRWGRWTRRRQLGAWPVNSAMAGLDNSVSPWLKKRDIAILGWETPDYAPHPEGDISNAVHNFVLGILGVPILDRADFDAVSEAAAARGRWEFLITIAPLPIPNGTGSPVNPIAVF